MVGSPDSHELCRDVDWGSVRRNPKDSWLGKLEEAEAPLWQGLFRDSGP